MNRIKLIHISLIILTTTLIYLNSFAGSFHFDDNPWIVENPRIKHLSNIPEILKRMHRPLPEITFALNYYFGGLNVFGYHLVNLIIHIAVSILIYLILNLTISGQWSVVSSQSLHLTPHSSRLTPYFSLPFMASLLFATHPIQTESVTYIVSRYGTLCTFFYLLSLYLFIKGMASPPHASPLTPSSSPFTPHSSRLTPYLFFIGSLLAFILALASKEDAITLPLIAIIYTYYFIAPDKRPLHFLRDYRFLLLYPLIFLILLYFLFRHFFFGGIEGTIPLKQGPFTPYTYLLTELRVIPFYYLYKLVLPIRLNVDPDIPISTSIFNPWTLLGLLIILALLALAIRWSPLFNRNPDAKPFPTPHCSLLTPHCSFGLLWFIITLLPTSSIVPLNDPAAEHRLYLPSLGFVIVLSVVIYASSHMKKIIGITQKVSKVLSISLSRIISVG